MWILVAVLPFILHEFGHYIASCVYRHPIKFTRLGWRFVWQMPSALDEDDKMAVAIAGFAFEMFAAIPMNFCGDLLCGVYLTVTCIHFCAYPFYAGEYNDFKFLA